ncbi:hypothetical protein [Actinoplanes solisilvae]|uniref:hypothetical protein n=1 Tax=Actinoplanes solisilvae TaxID=2486853 RepID=UPI0013E28881|nr:hypothetical protein [Actinoplanes solisilvae]
MTERRLVDHVDAARLERLPSQRELTAAAPREQQVGAEVDVGKVARRPTFTTTR